jgi:SAM-dependent methyltransferase
MLEHAQALLMRGFERLGFRVERLRPRPLWAKEQLRISYQERYVTFPIARGSRVLDIGSGGYPFPLATVHLDRYPTAHWSRYEPLAPVDKPFVTGDMHHLPFRDQSIDFIYASHVLQSVDDPICACAEMMRVGKAGFIEIPTFGKTTLFSWGKGLMKWHAVGIDRHLCFFEYSDRQLEGVRSPVWRDLIMSRWYEPLQGLFFENQDVFNVLFSWTGSFSVFVFALDGSVRTLNVSAELRPPTVCHTTDSEQCAELTVEAQRS